MRSNITRRLYIGFSTAIFLVVAVGVSSYLSFKRQAEEQHWVKHNFEVASNLQDIRITLTEMRSDIRSFLLTDDTIFLSNFKNGQSKIFPQLNNLKDLLGDNKDQLNYEGL